jgi:hypothetical protein
MEPIDQFNQSEVISARPTGIRYGLILGLISSVLSAVMMMTNMVDFSGTKSNWLSNVISWGVSIFIFYKAIETYKEELGGFITLGKCISVSFWTGLISGAISAAFLFVYFKFIDVSFLEKTLDLMRANMEEKGMSSSEIDSAISITSWLISPGFMSFAGLLGGIFMGVLVGLILGLIMKKDPPSFA